MRIICDKFNKGPIYKSVIGVREIPSMMCLGRGTVSLFVTGEERRGRGVRRCGELRVGCLRMLQQELSLSIKR